MKDIFESVDLGLNHLQVIIRGMYAVAKADDVHQAELVMLREFYAACRSEGSGLADFDDVIAQDFDKDEALEILDTPELRRALLTSCVLLAFADGEFSEKEGAVIDRIAADMGVGGEALAAAREEVQDYLLRQISKIQNVDALLEVAGELRAR